MISWVQLSGQVNRMASPSPAYKTDPMLPPTDPTEWLWSFQPSDCVHIQLSWSCSTPSNVTTQLASVQAAK